MSFVVLYDTPRKRAFSPLSLSPELWLDATQITGLVDGTAVDTWLDASGNARNATAAGATRPLYKTAIINSKPVVRFDGTDDFMDLGDNAGDGKTSYTILVVGRRANYVGQQPWFSNRHLVNPETDTYYGVSGAAAQFLFQDSAAPAPDMYGLTALTNAAPYALMVVVTPTARQFYLTGVANGNDAYTNSATKIYSGYIGKDTGTGDFLNGDIAEIITFSTALDAGQRALLFAYTLAKWGV